jgi:hypothetical protein
VGRILAVAGVLLCTVALVIFGHRDSETTSTPSTPPGTIGASAHDRDAPPSPSPEASAAGTWPLTLPIFAPRPARLDVTLEHSLRWGRIRVWVDDALLVDKPLTSRITKKVLMYKERRGHFHETVDAPPGDHQVRVRVDGDGFDEERRLRTHLKSDATSQLSLDVGGILTKDLEVAWKP